MLDRALAGTRGRRLWLGLSSATAAAQLSSVETHELRLSTSTPFQTYLVPHVGALFHQLAQLRARAARLHPPEKFTVLLTDFSDSGNASATAVPRDFLGIEIAPISTAYEAVSPNERFNWLMNHELVHIATVDQAARADRRARALLRREGDAQRRRPGVDSVLLPHRAAKVLAELVHGGGRGLRRDLDGRRAGTRAGAVRRDGVPLDGPRREHDSTTRWGSSRKGRRSTSRSRSNSYLYGTRFVTYLGYRYSPEDVIRWISRPEGSAAYYAKNFEEVFGLPLKQAWADWIAFEKEFQNANLASIRKYPTTAYQGPFDEGARLGLARLRRSRRAEALRRIQLPRPRRAHRLDLDGRRHGRPDRRGQGSRPVHGDVARLGSRTSTCCSTRPTTPSTGTSGRSIRRRARRRLC